MRDPRNLGKAFFPISVQEGGPKGRATGGIRACSLCLRAAVRRVWVSAPVRPITMGQLTSSMSVGHMNFARARANLCFLRTLLRPILFE